jgi:hypothetical protein
MSGESTLDQRWFHVLIALVLACPLGLVLVLRQADDYGHWLPVSLGTWVFLAAWYGAFYAAMAVPIRTAAAGSSVDVNVSTILLSLAGAVGAGVMTYEFAVARGYGFSYSVNDLRVLQIETATAGFVGSWLGGLGRLLISAIVVAWVTACLHWRRMKPMTIIVMLLSSALVFAYQARFEGGRIFAASLTLAALMATAMFIVADVSEGGRIVLSRIRLRHFAPVVMVLAMFVGVFVYSSYTFSKRGEYTAERIDRILESEQLAKAPETGKSQQGARRGLNRLDITALPNWEKMPPYALAYLRYASDFDIDVEALTRVKEFTPGQYRQAMAWIYLTQGINEFDRIFTMPDLKHAMGFYEFPQVAQVLSKLAGKDLRYALAENLPNVGTYITGPGAAYLDFGYFGALVLAVLLGLVLRAGIDSGLRNRASPMALCAPLVFVIVGAGVATCLVTNLWTSFLWIAAMAIGERIWSRIRSRSGPSAYS